MRAKGFCLQQKVFRIEAMLGKPRAARAHLPSSIAPNSVGNAQEAAYKHELAAVRDAIARSERELAALRSGVPASRLQQELGAAIGGMDDATQKILSATEVIDESARALQASLQNDYNRGLAQEVLEQAVKIYEACNFQDLAGQRINKAIAALKHVEHQLDRLAGIWGKVEHATSEKLINGPKLGDDHGHADQQDIDRMFARSG
jgi:chemotaxis protein CheZ